MFAFKGSAVENPQFLYLCRNVGKIPENGNIKIIHIKNDVGIHIFCDRFVDGSFDVILKNNRKIKARL